MIYGSGIDIIEIRRIQKSLEKYSDRFENRIFTSREIAYCRVKAYPARHFAARFAVKEATLKALGTGIRGGVEWKDLEVFNEENSGRPVLKITGKGLEIFKHLKLKSIHISISHDDKYAIAQAIAEL
tara:strand:- start:2007 stop:2387 length:381 start_codon:yes stop_codon:yes gene_type:complete